MRWHLLARLMLCMAAVLLIPQALDCCAHSETMLGMLAENHASAMANSDAMPEHATTHHGQSHSAEPADLDQVHPLAKWTPVDFCLIDRGGGEAPSAPGISASDGREAGQTPSTAAARATRIWHPEPGIGKRLGLSPDEDGTGRAERPETPPPQI